MKNKIKQLLAEQDRIDTERNEIRNQISELETKSRNLLEESCKLEREIEKIKEDGTNRFLGKYAKIGKPKWGHYVYMYIVSVANEYHGCIAAFNGPSFDYFGDVVHIRWSLESAHNSFCATIDDLNEIQIISKEEFLNAYNECANKAKNEFILNNISTEFILTDGNCPVIQKHNTPKGKSDHYFTYLNKNNEPKFNFTAHTKTQMKDVIQKIDNVNIDVVFFDRISPSFMDMVNNIKSKNKNTLIVFEPSCKTDEKHFMDCVNLSHIIKFSEQRIPNIDVFDSVNNKFIIQTRGKNGLIFKIRNSDWMEVPPVPLNGMKIVNSVGAGDWTTATLIDNLYKMRGKKLSNEEIKEALYSAQIGAVTSLGFKTPRK